MIPNDTITELLTTPGERLPFLMAWLKDHIWSRDNFSQLTPADYIERGEAEVLRLEELIFAAAWSLYDEMVAQALVLEKTAQFFSDSTPTAVVVFDGASIRELPLFEKYAEETGFRIVTSGYGWAALPSDTEFFIEQRLLGKRMAPSQLVRRLEWREKQVAAFYYDAPIRQFMLSGSPQHLLLWSHFPDGTYRDLSAKFSAHFSELLRLYDTVWRNMVMQIPAHYQIIITSDHGYIFFGPGLDSHFQSDAPRLLNQDRYRFLLDDKTLPTDDPGIQFVPEKKLALLRGRLKNRPQGPAGNKIYRHGGLSLMEMLTPYLVIQRI